MRKTNCKTRTCAPALLWRALLAAAAMAMALTLGTPGAAAQIGITTVQGTIYRADGTPAGGTVLVSWNAFTTPQNQAVAAGSISAAIGADGFLSVNLTPNAGALPAGSYYTVVYHLGDGTVSQEYWVVPAAGTASVASVRAELEPSTVAVASAVTPAYVQGALSALGSTYLPLAGGTLTGSLTLNGDPAAPNQASTRHYVDQSAAQELPLAGGTLTGPLTVPSLIAQQIEGTFSADQKQSGSGNNGIAMSLQECASLPYACEVLAPAVYAQTEQPAWEFWNWTNTGTSQRGTLSTLALTDQRFAGSAYYTNANPATEMPGVPNLYSGFSWYVPYSGALVSNSQNYQGGQIGAWLFAGGDEQMTYNGQQSLVRGLSVMVGKNAASAEVGDVTRAYAWAPGDAALKENYLSGPGGYVNADDEGVEYYSSTNDETPYVPTGTVTIVAGDALTAPVTVENAPAGATGTQGAGRLLLDTTNEATVTPTAVRNQVATPILGSTYGYFSSMTFSSVPADSAWGTLTEAVSGPGTYTITYTASSGTPTTNTLTCVASEASNGLGARDQIYPSSVASGAFTAAWSTAFPSGAVWTQGGDCGKADALNADTVPVGTVWNNGESSSTTTYAVQFPWMNLGSIDGVNDLFATASAEDPAYGNLGFGSRWGNSNYPETVNQYPALLVTSVVGANGDTSDGVYTFNVPASTVFSTGNTVEESQPPAQSHSGGHVAISQYSPFGSMGGEAHFYYGRFSSPSGGSLQWNRVPVTQYNFTPFLGTNNGGADALPGAALYCEGPWGSCIYQTDDPNTGDWATNAVVGWAVPPTQETSEEPILRPSLYGVWQPSAISYIYNAGASYASSQAWDAVVNNNIVTRTWSGGLSLLNGDIYLSPISNPTAPGTGSLAALSPGYNSSIIWGGCGIAASCGAMTDGFDFLRSPNAAGGSDILKYWPATEEWLITSGATTSTGGSAVDSMEMLPGTGFIWKTGTTHRMTLSDAGNLAVPGGITGATINGEITVDGRTYTTLGAAWSAAVAQANATSQDQTVRLGPGTFPVTATLSEPSNGACVSLLGSAGTTINADSPQVTTTLTVPSPLSGDVFYLGNAAQAQGCTFNDLSILAKGNATHGFELLWFRGLLIDNVAVNDTTAEGILLGEENTTSGHQANFLLRNITVSYSTTYFTPASRPAYGIHLQETAIDSSLDNILVRNALTAGLYNEGTGNTGYLIHGFGYPYTCTTAPCVNNASSASAANASWASSYVIYDTGGGGSEWTDTYIDSPAVAGFYIGANGISIEGGHVQWPDLTSFSAANLAYVAPAVTNNLLIGDVSCLGMAASVNWITYAGTAGDPPTFSSVHHLTGCGNYYEALEPAVTTGFSSGGANIDDPSGAVPRVWATPLAAASSDAAFDAQMYTGYEGDAYQAHFSGANPFFNITYQGTIRSSGGLALSTIVNTASTLTLTAANKNVIANAASGAQTITLPSCYAALPDKAAPTGLEFTIIKSDTSSNAVTLETVSSENINYLGVSAQTLAIAAAGKRTLVCGPDYNWYAY